MLTVWIWIWRCLVFWLDIAVEDGFVLRFVVVGLELVISGWSVCMDGVWVLFGFVLSG